VVNKKYSKDYRLENRLTQNGKLVTIAVYQGEYYVFSADRLKLLRSRNIIAALSIIYWISFSAGLVVDSGAMHRWYVSFPYFAGFLPAAFLVSSVYYLIRFSAKTPEKGFTREQRDKVYGRLSQCSLTMLILSCVAAAGIVVYYIPGAGGEKVLQDITVTISVLTMIFTSAAILKIKKHTKMQAAS
jgi:hypothetical protein